MTAQLHCKYSSLTQLLLLLYSGFFALEWITVEQHYSLELLVAHIWVSARLNCIVR